MRTLLSFAALAFLLFRADQTAAEDRFSLVIGNSNYEHTWTLTNPANDANRIGRELKHLSFDGDVALDVSHDGMKEAIELFAARLKAGVEDHGRDAVGVLFYAGHAVQVEGVNYLIPIDAVLDQKKDLRRAVSLDWITGLMRRAGNRTNIIIVDACRDDPFPTMRSASRSVANRGLARRAAPSGMLIAYATSPGETAIDTVGGSNSPYSRALAKYMQQPGLEVTEMFQLVRLEVQAATPNQQTSWEMSSLTSKFFFAPDNGSKVAAAQCPPKAGPYRVTGFKPNEPPLNVREGPGTTFDVVGTLPFGAAGISQAECNEAGTWCKMTWGCLAGWVKNKYLETDAASVVETFSEAPVQGLFRVFDVVPKDKLHIRQDMSSEAGSLAQIPSSSKDIEVGECEVGRDLKSKWCRVTFGGVRGWVNARYLRNMENEEPPE